MPRIIILQADNPITVELTSFPAKMGRSPDGAVVIADNPQVSRTHAQIVEDNGQYFLEDLGGANFTFQNGKQIPPRTRSDVPLADSDRLKLGPVKLRFEMEAAAAAVAGAAPEDRQVDISDEMSSTIMGVVQAQGFGVFEVRPEDKLKGILRINQSLAGQVDPNEMAPRILDALFDIFPQADRGSIVVQDESSDRLVPAAQKLRDETEDESVRLSRTVVTKVMEEKTGILSADAASDERFNAAESISNLTIRSMMCVPLLGLQGDAFGVINLDTQNPISRFTQEDLELLLAVASQAAASYETVRLMKSYLQKQKQDAEMKIAMQVQKSLLPDELPSVAGYQFFASYDAAQAVGGDYFDCFELDNGKICVSFGDVAGKGVPGALIMSRISSVVQNTMGFTDDVSEAIRRINHHMCHNMVSGRFVTYTLAVIDPANNHMAMINSGHFPLLTRHADGSIEEVGTEAIGIPIGIMADYPYQMVEREIAPGDLFVLRTDGVDEAMAPNGDLYTTERVLEFVKTGAQDPEELGKAMLADVRKHANGRAQNDDIAIMTFGRLR